MEKTDIKYNETQQCGIQVSNIMRPAIWYTGIAIGENQNAGIGKERWI